MAALTATNPTLLDFAKRTDPDGSIAVVAEVLSETNEVLEDMTFVEGNLPTGNKTTIRSGLPVPTWRKLYGGVQPTKSSTVQVVDTCGMLEAYAEVDKALADLSNNAAAFRLSEDRAHIEGMNKQFSSTLFYGNDSTTPEAFTGFAPRFNLSSAESGQNIIKADASPSGSDNSSIWLVGWGPNTVHGIIPKGSKAGLQIEDKGAVTVENVDGSNGRAEMYRTHYRWDVGLTVRDWRYVVRIANIDVSQLTKSGSTGSDLIDCLSQALELIPSLSMCRPVFYASRTVRSVLRRQIANKVASSTLTMDMVAGKHVLTFDGIPFKRCDAILNTESTVS
jgi:hypothetical protein